MFALPICVVAWFRHVQRLLDKVLSKMYIDLGYVYLLALGPE